MKFWRFWRWLDGKKSAIGTTMGAISAWAMSKGWIGPDEMNLIAVLLTIWTGVAIGHKIQKSRSSHEL